MDESHSGTIIERPVTDLMCPLYTTRSYLKYFKSYK